MKIKQTTTSDIAAKSASLNAPVDDQEAEEYLRGHADGIAWARNYATVRELRDLVEDFEHGGGGDFDMNHYSVCDVTSHREDMTAVSVPRYDNLHWRGFVAGAEEVLDEGSALLSR